MTTTHDPPDLFEADKAGDDAELEAFANGDYCLSVILAGAHDHHLVLTKTLPSLDLPVRARLTTTPIGPRIDLAIPHANH